MTARAMIRSQIAKESDLQRLILDYLGLLRKQGAPLWFKRVRVGTTIVRDSRGVRPGPNPLRGVPDIVGCFGGRFFGWEIKTAKGKLSPHQIEEIDGINAAGGHAVVIRSLEDAERSVKHLKAGNGP